MPFKSQAQRAFFNANRAKMEKQGVDVDEWNQASKGKSLPARAPKKKSFGQRIAANDHDGDEMPSGGKHMMPDKHKQMMPPKKKRTFGQKIAGK